MMDLYKEKRLLKKIGGGGGWAGWPGWPGFERGLI